MLRLECIRYEPGIKLDKRDELRLLAVIQRTVMEEPIFLVIGVKIRTSMIRFFDATYRQVDEIQTEAHWDTVLHLKYLRGCLIEYISKFKAAARVYQNSGGESSESLLSMIFKQ